MEIIIGTTAINRPELHSDNMGKWYNWINSLDKTKYNINVDYIGIHYPKFPRNLDLFLHMLQEWGKFAKISTSFCKDYVNYERNFMEKYNIKKTKIQNDSHTDFYR